MGTSNSKLTYHDRLGKGHCGEVYRVTWKSKDHGTIEAAAKKIKYKPEGELTDQEKHEIEVLKRLRHKNIIRYYETISEEDYVIIVTELAAKGSLYDYLKTQDKLHNKLQITWIYHLASGVDYLKQNGLTHRDLKSPNCVITAEDVLKICDFGLARYLTTTTTTNMKGTARWLPPEAIRDQQLSPKADIFAFAIISWEIVTCEEPYKGMRVETVMFQVCERGLRPTIPSDCPTFLKDLIAKCWHVDHRQRPESGDLVNSIRSYANWLESPDIGKCINSHFK